MTIELNDRHADWITYGILVSSMLPPKERHVFELMFECTLQARRDLNKGNFNRADWKYIFTVQDLTDKTKRYGDTETSYGYKGKHPNSGLSYNSARRYLMKLYDRGIVDGDPGSRGRGGKGLFYLKLEKYDCEQRTELSTKRAFAKKWGTTLGEMKGRLLSKTRNVIMNLENFAKDVDEIKTIEEFDKFDKNLPYDEGEF